jgi:hypothetical protein
VRHWPADDLGSRERPYREVLRVPAMSAGRYALRAGEDHRFHDVTEDLQVLVVFAPAESAPS